MIRIVLGVGFGDEGKGQAVHSLSHQNSLVIRFSGGHQCGHTAINEKGVKHIFAQFGAGTLKGAPTYISQYCTVFPTGFVNEYKALKSLQIVIPQYFVHPLAMVTTPYDLAFNRALSMITGHGTCGVGFGTTLQRNEDFYNLYVNDLKNPYILKTKIEFISRYYENKVKALNMSSQITYEQELEQAFTTWQEDLDFYKANITIKTFNNIANQYTDHIFEGSQGILLDQHFGFFPHVTRSNTTSQNALDIINQSILAEKDIETFYISRCYQTRHGNGPFPEDKKVELINIETESNQENDWQGIFKSAQFDPELVRHAIECDRVYNPLGKKILLLTSYDQLKDKNLFNSQLSHSNLNEIVDEIGIKDRPDWIF